MARISFRTIGVRTAATMAPEPSGCPPTSPRRRSLSRGLAPAELVVTDSAAAAEKVPPLGANGWGGCGAIDGRRTTSSATRATSRSTGGTFTGREVGPNWFEIDGPGTSWWDLWDSGLLSGAELRIYRLVDQDGKPLPDKDDYLDVEQADHVEFVGQATSCRKARRFSGRRVDRQRLLQPVSQRLDSSRQSDITDASGLENGRAYWYAVVAVGANNQESEMPSRISVTPQAGGPPRRT